MSIILLGVFVFSIGNEGFSKGLELIQNYDTYQNFTPSLENSKHSQDVYQTKKFYKLPNFFEVSEEDVDNLESSEDSKCYSSDSHFLVFESYSNSSKTLDINYSDIQSTNNHQPFFLLFEVFRI